MKRIATAVLLAGLPMALPAQVTGTGTGTTNSSTGVTTDTTTPPATTRSGTRAGTQAGTTHHGTKAEANRGINPAAPPPTTSSPTTGTPPDSNVDMGTSTTARGTVRTQDPSGVDGEGNVATGANVPPDNSNPTDINRTEDEEQEEATPPTQQPQPQR